MTMNNVTHMQTAIREIEQTLFYVDSDAEHPAHDRRHSLHRQCLAAIAALQQRAIELQLHLHTLAK